MLTSGDGFKAHDGLESHDGLVLGSLAFLQHNLHFVSSGFEVVRVSEFKGDVHRLV